MRLLSNYLIITVRNFLAANYVFLLLDTYMVYSVSSRMIIVMLE